MEDFSLHHLIGFMGGLQVNSLVFTSQNEKRLAILPVFFRFYLFFSFLINVKILFCGIDFIILLVKIFPFPIQYFWQINTIFTNIVLMFL